ncbi:MAG: hypothetical protein AAF391_13805, partial [Bacteroidota bacterium]
MKKLLERICRLQARIKFPNTLFIKAVISGLAFVLTLSALQYCTDGDSRVASLLEKHAEAMGGKEKWASLKSYRKVFDRPDGQKMTMTCLMPDKISLHFEKDELDLIKAYDGEHGYLIRNGVYEPMRAGEAIEMAEEPDYYSELIFALERGYEVKYLGAEEVEGIKCEKLSVKKSEIDEQLYWLNAETHLIEQTGEYSEDTAHDGIYYLTRMGDYQDVNGYMFPYSQRLIPSDRDPIVSTVSEIEVDFTIDTEAFSFEPEGTENLIRYWKDRYQEGRLMAFTFVQETIRFRDGEVRDTATWYEAVQYPNFFRIDLGEKDLKNRNLYRNDSVYVIREGELVRQGR